MSSVSQEELIMHLDNLGLTSMLKEGEKNTYLQICQAYNLNPFKREVHVSKYGDTMSIITGYEVYIKRAERSGQLDGWSAKTTGSILNNDLKAIVTIHRKDRSHPFEWEASYNEFVQRDRQGNITKFWQKADFMIKKVAISQAFRLCFSDELGGMPYTKEELPEVEDIQAEVVTSQVNGNKPFVKKPFKDEAGFEAAVAKIKTFDLEIDRDTFTRNVEGVYVFTDDQKIRWDNAKANTQ